MSFRRLAKAIVFAICVAAVAPLIAFAWLEKRHADTDIIPVPGRYAGADDQPVGIAELLKYIQFFIIGVDSQYLSQGRLIAG